MNSQSGVRSYATAVTLFLASGGQKRVAHDVIPKMYVVSVMFVLFIAALSDRRRDRVCHLCSLFERYDNVQALQFSILSAYRCCCSTYSYLLWHDAYGSSESPAP
jgi:hypothetical protein